MAKSESVLGNIIAFIVTTINYKLFFLHSHVVCRQVVAPEQCFWIPAEYFAAAVEYISRAFAAENDLSVDGRSSQASSLAEVTAYST